MYVKVCGITNEEDARRTVDAGADVIGLNLIPESKRFVPEPQAIRIARSLRHQPVAVVAVVAHRTLVELAPLSDRLEVDCLQLHGAEPPEWIEALGPRAFGAVRIGSAEDVALARRYPGHPLLLDAKVKGQLGGTGKALDWPLVAELARQRAIVLAGGLTPENVAEAIAVVSPYAVDVASGVERDTDPRRKDPAKLARFVQAARQASTTSAHDELPFCPAG